MAGDDFLCSLEVPDPVLMPRGGTLRVHGWIIPSDGVGIERIAVRVNGAPPVAARFPEPREDVARYYPNLRNAHESGFMTPPIALEFGAARELDVEVTAMVNGAERAIAARRARLLWHDPENEIYPLGQPGPFLFPEQFDMGRISPRPGKAPVFVAGTAPAMARAREALRSQGRELPEGGEFTELLKAVVECHDAFAEWRNTFYVHLEAEREKYLFGKFDIHRLLDDLVGAFDARLAGGHVAPAFGLTGIAGLAAVPLLRRIYPDGRFILLRAVDDAIEPPARTGRYADPFTKRDAGQVRDALRRDPAPAPLVERDAPRAGTEAAAFVAGLGLGEGPRGVTGYAGPEPDARAPYAPDTEWLGHVPRHGGGLQVFIVGAGRSGTSAMGGAVHAGGIAEGRNEGHVIPMLRQMLRRSWAGNSPQARPFVIATVVASTVRQVYGDFGDASWADKTPDHWMLESLPLAAAAFPDARYIFMRRHPVSFAESRLRKFREPLLSAINEWTKCNDAWDAAKGCIDERRRIECDADSLRQPRTQDRVAALLGLDAAQREQVRAYLTSQRPEFTRAGGRDPFRDAADLPPERQHALRAIFFGMLADIGEYLDDMRWGAAEKAEVERLLGEQPARFGYALRRPEGRMIELLARWAREMESCRHEARLASPRPGEPQGGGGSR